MINLSNVTLSILLGFLFVSLVWLKTRKFPSYQTIFNAFLIGGSVYGGFSLIYWALTGYFFLNDTIETIRIFVAITGLSLFRLAYDSYRGL